MPSELSHFPDCPAWPPGNSPSRYRQVFESTPLAKTFPAFSEVMGDAAGYLWVREYDFPGEPRPAPLWTVFDPGGRVLGFATHRQYLQSIVDRDVLDVGRVRDARGMARLAALCGDDFEGGILLYNGRDILPLADERVLAVPLSELWER